MDTLYREPYFYAVQRNPSTGEYFLEVTCGTSAVYELRVKLKKAEIESFLRDETALGVLAMRILDAPGSYQDRRI